jgi:hypothetical protein
MVEKKEQKEVIENSLEDKTQRKRHRKRNLCCFDNYQINQSRYIF